MLAVELSLGSFSVFELVIGMTYIVVSSRRRRRRHELRIGRNKKHLGTNIFIFIFFFKLLATTFFTIEDDRIHTGTVMHYVIC